MEYPILETWGSGGPPIDPLRLATDPSPDLASRVIYTAESRTLQQCKSEINTCYEVGKWDDYKKITNPYEYIFLSWNRRSSRSVAQHQPLSRSYFKMIELWKRLDLAEELYPIVRRDGGFCSAHAAEGPGGFIEACFRAVDDAMWDYNGANAMTLRSDAKNIPGWRKAAKFLDYYKQISILEGADGTGNILLPENQAFFVETTRRDFPRGVHVYTADGGFDFSSDYNAQEDAIFPLFLAEALLGLQVVCKGGCIIIKCFDTTEQPTLDLLWLLSRAFCEWGLVKPRTSRAGNAERYFVGKGFLDDAGDIVALLNEYQARAKFTHRILSPITSPGWRTMIEQIASFQEQVEHLEVRVIRETLELIKTTDPGVIKRLVRENVIRSLAWCREHRESTTASWVIQLDKFVAKETSDLLQILHPAKEVMSYDHSWVYRTQVRSNLTFEKFRSDATEEETNEIVFNPFQIIKHTYRHPK